MSKAISAGYCVWYFPRTEDGKPYPYQDPDFYAQPYILLVQQYGMWSEKKGDYKKKSGTWSIPKGHVKEGETLEQCAARELEEETCVSLGPIQTLSTRRLTTKSVRPSLGGKKENKVIHMFGHVLQTPHEELLICTKDKAITSCGWYTFKKAKRLLHKSDFDAMQRLYNKYMWRYVLMY